MFRKKDLCDSQNFRQTKQAGKFPLENETSTLFLLELNQSTDYTASALNQRY